MINFLGLGRLDLLLASRRTVMSAEVDSEVRNNRAALDAAMADDHVRVETVFLGHDAALFARLTRRLSVADASAIVLAGQLGADLAADDRILRREAAANLPGVHLIGTEGLLAEAVQAGLLSLEEGDELLRELLRLRYRPKVPSLRQLLAPPPE
jgi:predicted nucleic acid-binding protein